MHSVLDFSMRELELPLVASGKNSVQEESICVSLYSLPRQEIFDLPAIEHDPSELIFKHQFEDSECLVDVKNHITKELNIPGESQILLQYFPKTKSFKAAPLPENVKILSLLKNAKDEGFELILLLAFYQQGVIEPKVKEQLQKYNIAELNGFAIRGYATKHIIMMMNTSGFNLVVENVLKITGLCRQDQLYFDNNGVTVESTLPEDSPIKDVYLATKSLDLEQRCFEWGVKIFKTFKLKFLTKMEELPSSKYKFVSELKNHLLKIYKIRKCNQSLVLQGRELEDSENIFSLMISEWYYMRDLTINLFVVQGKFDVRIAPCWKIDFTDGDNGPIKIEVQGSTTIADVKNLMIPHFKPEPHTFVLSLHRSQRTNDEEFLPETKTMKECLENIDASADLSG